MIDVRVGSPTNAEAVVLENVNWKMAVRDYWAIAGLQGSGKSDLMVTAAGLMRPLAGIFKVFGHELGVGFEHETMSTRLRIGLVFEGGRPLHQMTVAQNVALPLRYHRNLTLEEAASQIEPLLQFTGLSDLADRSPGGLRRNLQQRVGLARALVLRPDILLLDNPLSMFDSRESAWWVDVLDQLAAGHPVTGGRPITLAVTDDNFRPWRERARQFATLREKKFIAIGGRSELASSTDPLVHEMLRPELLAM
jgi:ABC-type transporter Mla maintaining outer membrane lipid asymmetry ATPase subunit MlaF